MVDQWIEWHDTHVIPESREETVNEFLRHFCARNAIPATFFLGLASWEFSNSPNVLYQTLPITELARTPSVSNIYPRKLARRLFWRRRTRWHPICRRAH